MDEPLSSLDAARRGDIMAVIERIRDELKLPILYVSHDRADVEPWLDGFMASSLPRGDIAGATVAIAKDGEVLLTKGYGYADTQKRVPVDADRHLFRVASISKLFTWTAVLQ